ncbi:MAG: undecaprenyl/decaprenyl-phosphate alpha-N-acetylglucosaminyl 1-phosphate transferase [Chloroflexi bacterium]|nr:MAG: undecaprenyl/decaprenyl-phosphate alpha-N-acetylglucosaminyl 1-phosphate transferase [Phototrophicales bacterium]RMF76667.1 MAG: undecaprenyl/decaprenyl-phosphate alpha-N-acetylglucosaminyl 1-phosphate transferase [Chloroflexota bacterium]
MPFLAAETLQFMIVFLLALSTSLILVPVAMYLSHRYGIIDEPGGRREHERPTPRLGGLALYGSFVITVIVAQFLPVPRFDSLEIVRLTGLLIGGTFIFIVGLLDDIFEFSALVQYIGQIVAAGIAIAFLIFIETFNNPLTGTQTDPFPFVVTVTLSLFWLGLMMNTVNFLDGLDGLAGGVAFIAGTMLFINSAFRLQPPQTSVSLLPLALMGASLGFLLFNFYPAQIFMGSNGSFFLGYTLGVLSIIGGAKMATILLVMGLPLLDVGWQIVNRLREGRSPFEGDRGHVHFRLIDAGWGQRRIVILYYLFCALFGVLTLLTGSQLFKFIALTVMVLLAIVGFAVLSRASAQVTSSSSS